jgi:ATP-dependent Clp protease ATP-binding subunit ClpB
MAANDNFDESKYTETAWSSISGLPKVSDFYETTTVEAPLLLDMMLNPNKHGGNEKAEAAKKVVDRALSKAGVDMKQLRSDLESHFSKQPRLSSSSGSGSAQKAMGRSLQKVLETARITQNVLGDSFISTEGLLLALIKEDDIFTRDALLRQTVSYTDVLKVIQQIREKNGPAISRSAETMYDALLKYGIDFTERAREGKLDPVIGRDDEIRRTIQILSRRTKNNPVLIGDPVRC